MFKWLLDNSLTNRLLVIIASVVLMAYGAFTLSRTPVDVFPDPNKPTVTIITEAGGMAAEEVEQLITFPLETTMNGLPGVESVRSTSSERQKGGMSFSRSTRTASGCGSRTGSAFRYLTGSRTGSSAARDAFSDLVSALRSRLVLPHAGSSEPSGGGPRSRSPHRPTRLVDDEAALARQ